LVNDNFVLKTKYLNSSNYIIGTVFSFQTSITNYFRLEEKNKLFQKSANFNDLNVLVDLLIMKLMVKNDKGDLVKAFQPEDKFALRKKADTTVVANIANKILTDASYEEAEKK